jgi:hypothetical protein
VRNGSKWDVPASVPQNPQYPVPSVVSETVPLDVPFEYTADYASKSVMSLRSSALTITVRGTSIPTTIMIAPAAYDIPVGAT